MQRDIKFKYVYSNGTDFKEFVAEISDIEIGRAFSNADKLPWEYKLKARLQYTGLKDNDREIWEGDVYEHPNGQRFVVCYSPTMTGFRAFYSDDDTCKGSSIAIQISDKGRAKYIGSAITQPELLEGEL